MEPRRMGVGYLLTAYSREKLPVERVFLVAPLHAPSTNKQLKHTTVFSGLLLASFYQNLSLLRAGTMFMTSMPPRTLHKSGKKTSDSSVKELRTEGRQNRQFRDNCSHLCVHGHTYTPSIVCTNSHQRFATKEEDKSPVWAPWLMMMNALDCENVNVSTKLGNKEHQYNCQHWPIFSR